MRKILFSLCVIVILFAMSNCNSDSKNEENGKKEPQKIYRVIYDGNGNVYGTVPVDDNLYATGDRFWTESAGTTYADLELLEKYPELVRPTQVLMRNGKFFQCWKIEGAANAVGMNVWSSDGIFYTYDGFQSGYVIVGDSDIKITAIYWDDPVDLLNLSAKQ